MLFYYINKKKMCGPPKNFLLGKVRLHRKTGPPSRNDIAWWTAAPQSGPVCRSN